MSPRKASGSHPAAAPPSAPRVYAGPHPGGRTIQRAAESKAPAKPTISKEGLEVDHWLLVKAAGAESGMKSSKKGMFAEIPKHIRKLTSADVSYDTSLTLKTWLSTAQRNSTSKIPFHNSEEGNLPIYKLGRAARLTPYPEYLVPSGGGVRLVVDVVDGTVFLSYHYGQGQLKKGPKGTSPFVWLDRDIAPKEYDALVQNAKTWYNEAYSSMYGEDG